MAVNIMTKAAMRLLPRVFGKKMERVYRAVSSSIQRAYRFSRGVISESIPITAFDTLEEWGADFGVDVSRINDTGTKRRRLATAWSAIGGQSLDYVSREIRREFSQVGITETGTSTYTIAGDVSNNSSLQRLQGLQRRLAPLHCEPTYNVRIVEGLEIARHGVGATGSMITGKEE